MATEGYFEHYHIHIVVPGTVADSGKIIWDKDRKGSDKVHFRFRILYDFIKNKNKKSIMAVRRHLISRSSYF